MKVLGDTYRVARRFKWLFYLVPFFAKRSLPTDVFFQSQDEIDPVQLTPA